MSCRRSFAETGPPRCGEWVRRSIRRPPDYLTERSIDDDGELPVLRGAAASHAGRSGNVAPLRELSRSGSAELDGAVLPATRVRVRSLLARAARGVRASRAHLQRVRLFLLVLDLVVPARRDVHARDAGPFSARAPEPGHRDRQQ